MEKIRSFNQEDNKYYYFLNGRYWSHESCEPPYLVSERICHEFNWENAEMLSGFKYVTGNELYEGNKVKVVVKDNGNGLPVVSIYNIKGGNIINLLIDTDNNDNINYI